MPQAPQINLVVQSQAAEGSGGILPKHMVLLVPDTIPGAMGIDEPVRQDLVHHSRSSPLETAVSWFMGSSRFVKRRRLNNVRSEAERRGDSHTLT